MGKFITILILGVGLFFGGAWGLGLFDGKTQTGDIIDFGTGEQSVTPLADLGSDLYPVKKFAPIELPRRKYTDPIVLYGVMNAFETEEVPSQVQGRVLFIGDQVDDTAVLVGGSAAFLAEPYYFAEIYAGRQSFVKFYRRHYEGDVIKKGQMLGLVEPSEALGDVLKEIAKIAATQAEYQAAKAAEDEGEERFRRAERLYGTNAINKEDLGSARLTWIKLKHERISALEKIKLAEIDKDKADIILHKHEIRATLPYRTYTIKSIQRTAGTYLKQLDPVVMTVQNQERLLAEAQIEEQYAARLRNRKNITATIEPTVLEAPLQEFLGHNLDVTSLAISSDLKIVSASEDKSVCVWTLQATAPDRKLEHDDAVRVVACTPAGAKKNLCLAGCANGNLYLWDLSKNDDKPIRDPLPKAHGGDASITSLAFSPDGKYFASGASDGSIKIWDTEEGAERYAFTPRNGVEKGHDDAVTSLHFTPQGKLVSASRDKSLRVWQLKEKGASADGPAILDRKGNVPHLGVSRDGQWMLFDHGHTLKMYSVETKRPVFTLSVPANTTPFETLAIFSPDNSMLLTAGAPDGRMQLWRTPDANARGFEVRQFATRERTPVTCAAFSPKAGAAGGDSFAVSASGHKIYVWSIPTPDEVNEHRVQNVPLTLKSNVLDPGTKLMRIGFEVANPSSVRYPQGRFEAGRPVTIVID